MHGLVGQAVTSTCPRNCRRHPAGATSRPGGGDGSSSRPSGAVRPRPCFARLLQTARDRLESEDLVPPRAAADRHRDRHHQAHDARLEAGIWRSMSLTTTRTSSAGCATNSPQRSSLAAQSPQADELCRQQVLRATATTRRDARLRSSSRELTPRCPVRRRTELTRRASPARSAYGDHADRSSALHNSA